MWQVVGLITGCGSFYLIFLSLCGQITVAGLPLAGPFPFHRSYSTLGLIWRHVICEVYKSSIIEQAASRPAVYVFFDL
jgi:hypothetical protein